MRNYEEMQKHVYAVYVYNEIIKNKQKYKSKQREDIQFILFESTCFGAKRWKKRIQFVSCCLQMTRPEVSVHCINKLNEYAGIWLWHKVPLGGSTKQYRTGIGAKFSTNVNQNQLALQYISNCITLTPQKT